MPASIADTIVAWESKGLSNEKKIKLSIKANNYFSLKLRWKDNSKVRVNI